MSDNFGQRLRFYRSQRNLTQDDLAAPMGKTKSSISDWERDKAKPSLEEIVQLSEIIGCDPARLAFGNQAHLKMSESGIAEEPTQPYGFKCNPTNPRLPLIATPSSFETDASTAGIIEHLAEHLARWFAASKADPRAAAVFEHLVMKHLPLEDIPKALPEKGG